MDVNLVVAGWLQKCIEGEMTTTSLSAALQDLRGELQPPDADVRHRLDSLRRQVDAEASTDDSDPRRFEVLAVAFLGQRPLALLQARGAPDWHSHS